MKPVTQKHSFGCGAACIAFVSKKSYSGIVRILGENKARDRGLNCKDLIMALSMFGLAYTYKYLKPRLKRQIYHDNVIVFIRRSDKYPAGHYLVYSDGQWMDSWMNLTQNKDIERAQSGFRKRLPGTPIYALFPNPILTLVL